MQVITQVKTYPNVSQPIRPYSRFNDADYLAVMCHEIGTPLNAIIGLSRILADVECSPRKKQECSEMLRDSSNMLMELMKNMLDYSKIDSGMLEIEDINFDLSRVMQEAANIIASKAQEKGVALHVHIEKCPRQFIGDPLRMRQIILNLLSNAVKFTEKGNVTLYVNVTRDEYGNDKLCITVADTGIGMSEDSLEKIFGKYAQANSSISRQYGGTGLGLSISQELAHMMNGNITVKSWPGMGSHFIVTLPLQKIPNTASPMLVKPPTGNLIRYNQLCGEE